MNPKKKPDTQKPLFVSLLLDETGSMQPIKDPTIKAFNEYLEGLKKTEKDAPILFSLVTFNSSRTETRVVAEPVKSVKPLGADDYRPGAMTPLIDAAVKIIRATAEAVEARGDNPDVVVAIQTDGHENCSVEFDAGDLALLVKEKEQAGWQFVFLGAGLDAFAAATNAGIMLDADRVISYDLDHAEKSLGIVAAKMRRFYDVREASAMDFVAEERAELGDRWHKPSQAAEPKSPKKRDRKSSAGDISLG